PMMTAFTAHSYHGEASLMRFDKTPRAASPPLVDNVEVPSDQASFTQASDWVLHIVPAICAPRHVPQAWGSVPVPPGHAASGQSVIHWPQRHATRSAHVWSDPAQSGSPVGIRLLCDTASVRYSAQCRHAPPPPPPIAVPVEVAPPVPVVAGLPPVAAVE